MTCLEPEKFVEAAVNDFPAGENARQFVVRTVRVIRWGFGKLDEFGAKVDEFAFKALDAAQAWADGRGNISEIELSKKPLVLALISARGALVTVRGVRHLECEKDALNVMEFFINACLEIDESIKNPGSHEAGKTLGKFYGVAKSDIPWLISRVDRSVPDSFYANESVRRFFA